MSFDKDIKGRVLTYALKSELSEALAQTICTEAQAEVEKNAQIEAVVLDFKGFHISHSAFRGVTPFGLYLRKNKKQMYALTGNMEIHRMIKSEGMDKTLKPISNLSEIATESAPAEKSAVKLDVNFINPFIEGTVHVLKIQAQTDILPDKPFLKKADSQLPVTDIAGIIGITSKTFNGSIAICFSQTVFLAIMSKMFGEEFKEITKDLEDGAGEILNMVFGHAKRILNEKGHSFEKALPTIVRADNLSVTHSSFNAALILPFKTEAGIFFMEITTEKI